MDQNPTSPLLLRAASAVCALGLATATGVTLTAPAGAQMPGITIVQPPPNMPGRAVPGGMPGAMPGPAPGPGTSMVNPMMQPGPPMAAPQAPQQPAAEPQTKPKPKPKPKPATAKVNPDAIPGETVGRGGKGTRIAVLVNGEPITAYEIEQRSRLMALSADIQGRAQARMKELATSAAVNARWKQIVEETIKTHQHNKSREQIIAIIQEKQKAYSMGLQKQAIESARAAAVNQPDIVAKAREELIEELIKVQDAKRNGASPEESMVEDLIKDIAQRNGKSAKEFAAHFASMGVDISTLRAKFRSQLAWTETVRKQYSHLAVANNVDIDRLLKGADGGEDQVELQLRRIIIPVPPKVDQKTMAQRLAQAESLQAEFKECRTVPALAARVQGAKYDDMGTRRASTFTGISKTLLASAQENTMIPPTMTPAGIELLAVCTRRVVKGVDIKRNEKANELRQEKFELHARSHLRRLRTDAVIETR